MTLILTVRIFRSVRSLKSIGTFSIPLRNGMNEIFQHIQSNPFLRQIFELQGTDQLTNGNYGYMTS